MIDSFVTEKFWEEYEVEKAFRFERCFGESANHVFPDILKITVTHTLSWGIVS